MSMFSRLKTAFSPKTQIVEPPPPLGYEDPTIPPPAPPAPPRSPLLDQISDRTKKLIPRVSLKNILPSREPRRGETPSLEGHSYSEAAASQAASQATPPRGSVDSPEVTGPRTPPPNAASPPLSTGEIATVETAPQHVSPPTSGSSRDLPALPSTSYASPPREPPQEVPPPPKEEENKSKSKQPKRVNHFSLTEEIKKQPIPIEPELSSIELKNQLEASRRDPSPPKESLQEEKPVTVVRKTSPAIRISGIVEEDEEEEEEKEEDSRIDKESSSSSNKSEREIIQVGTEGVEGGETKRSPPLREIVEAWKDTAPPSMPYRENKEDGVEEEGEEETVRELPAPSGETTAGDHREEPLRRRISNLVYPNLTYFDDLDQEKDKIEHTRDIYVEERKSFRRTRRQVLETAMRQASDDREAQGILETAALKSVTHAIAFQTALNLLALTLQGFLSGLAVAHAVFAYVFAERDLLLRGYRWMALPVHATFMVCFILGIMAAVDRVRWHEFSWRKLRTWINAFGGLLQLIPMLIGLAASEMSLYFDESVAPSIKSPVLTTSSISTWKILSTVRAACAVFSWISVAFQPTNTAILEHIGMFMLPEEARDAHDFYKESGDATLAESRIPKVFGGVFEEVAKNMKERMGISSVPTDMSVLLKNAAALSSNPTDLPPSIPPSQTQS